MRVSVYDTYVRRKDEGLMHFDIIVPENSQLESVLRFGQAYLKEKGQEGQGMPFLPHRKRSRTHAGFDTGKGLLYL
jgi:hypothetical protein